ncbi:MAG: redoxin domain-containing protein [Planctomyces sp.]|nr:redoxin domain-containing protein [Planctomyces sp.]
MHNRKIRQTLAVLLLLIAGALLPWTGRLLTLRVSGTAQQTSADKDLTLTADLDTKVPVDEIDHDLVICVFISPHCPISNAYLPELARLADKYPMLTKSMMGVVPETMATEAEVKEFRTKFGVTFPVIRDRSNQLAITMHATHTPQVVVRRRGETIYSGRIDDRFVDLGSSRSSATKRDFEEVLSELQQGRVPSTRQTSPVGCVIERLIAESQSHGTKSQLTFNRDIAPVVFEHCSVCHRPGEVAPFSLMTFDDLLQHADQVKLVLERSIMPPWKPEPGFAEFRNEHRLNDREKQRFLDWLNSERNEGAPGDLPPEPEFTDGWQLGKPDLILEMAESFSVPSDGPDIYQHFVIPTGLTKDRLVNAVEFRPGAPEVVHHSIMYYDTTGRGRELDAEDPLPGYARMGSPGFAVTGSLGGWGPGGQPQPLPIAMGRPLEKGSDMIVQIHYHSIGRPMKDRSKIGLYFAPEGASHPVTEIMVASVELEIPAGQERHLHRAEYTLPVDTILFDVTPHMHVLGKEIRAQAFCPDGTVVPLIWIRDWNFYWQDKYVYQKPLELPQGTRIFLECWFDNSSRNPLNPNSPPRTVFWGDFSNDEMGICYFQATTRTADEYRRLNQHATSYFKDMWTTDQENRKRRLELTP